MTILKRYVRLLESLAFVLVGAGLIAPNLSAAFLFLLLAFLLDVVYCRLKGPDPT